MQRKFLYAGKCMYNCDGQGAFEQTIALANKNDLVIMISLSGESESTLAYAKQIKMKNIPLIAITKMKANKLVRLSDESISVIIVTHFCQNIPFRQLLSLHIHFKIHF